MDSLAVWTALDSHLNALEMAPSEPSNGSAHGCIVNRLTCQAAECMFGVIIRVSLFFATAGAPWLNGQITNAIRAHVDHSFVIGNTTLPPGEYRFRMRQSDPDLTVMTANSENDKTSAEFIVREIIDDHMPVIQSSFFGSMEMLSF